MFRSVTTALRGIIAKAGRLPAKAVVRAFRGWNYWSSLLSKLTDGLWVREFKKNTYLRSPVHRIAEDCSMVQWRLYRVSRDGSHKTRIFRHPLLVVWRRPCPYLTGTQARYLLRVWLELDGEAFLMIEWGGAANDEVIGLWPTPPHWVRRLPCDEHADYEVVFPGGQIYFIDSDSMIMFLKPDVELPYGRGLGAADAVAEEIEQLGWMNKFNRSFFQNAGHPGSVIGVENLDDENEERIKQQFEDRHKGYLNAFKALFISGKMQVHSASSPNKDLDFAKGKRELRDTARHNWAVPGVLLGDYTEISPTVLNAALNFHQRINLVTRLEGDFEAWNEYFVPLFGDQLELQYVSPVTESEEFRLTKATQGLNLGTVRKNEWRELNNFERDPKGDVYVLPLNTVTTDNIAMQIVQSGQLGIPEANAEEAARG